MNIPKPEEIKAARCAAGMTQEQAAEVIHSTRRTWQDWEINKACMHAGLWELFLIKTMTARTSAAKK